MPTSVCRLTKGRFLIHPVVLASIKRMASGFSESNARRNRLAQEKSPYLLQHASNPVDWYPWGQEAFKKAKEENKPIFLSVGYSTCHWCHVMERESFESEEIGKLLNDSYVSIKVDREERPDVDKVYMTFIQATQGGGGWPMSVFLTPDLKPFVGGTYFPPKDTYGRPGFPTLLKSIAEQWKSNQDRIVQQGSKVIDAISKAVSASHTPDSALPGTGCVQRGYNTLESRFDSTYGGFGREPKFPQPTILNFLLQVFARYPSSPMGERACEMTLMTLRAMANGGMHDHVAQGFHRYSTDKFWHVPHFEKMLYDQAQLASVYSVAYQISKDEFFAEMVRDILLYVSRDLRDKDGGFYSAEDADSYPTEGAEHKKEGAFCVWTQEEIGSILTDPLPGPTNSDKTTGDLFSAHYGVKPNGNVSPVQDPHDELKGQNVLIVRESLEKTASEFSLEVSQVRELLEKSREKLYTVRQQRPKPHRDDKILTAWNGLMISGLSHAFVALGDHTYLEMAKEAAAFIRGSLYREESGVLVRNAYRDSSGILGVGTIDGFADDYAYLIHGLMDLHEASHEQSWLQWAWQLQGKMNELFWDSEGGGYFTATSQDPSILIRMKEDQDGAEPSPNSVAASNLQRLSAYLGKPVDPGSEQIYKTFREIMSEHPVATPALLAAFIHHSRTTKQIVIAGEKGSADTQSLIDVVNSYFVPNKILILHEPGTETFLTEHLPVLSSMGQVDGKATAYVCENFTCSAPVNEPEALRKLINPNKSNI